MQTTPPKRQARIHCDLGSPRRRGGGCRRHHYPLCPGSAQGAGPGIADGQSVCDQPLTVSVFTKYSGCGGIRGAPADAALQTLISGAGAASAEHARTRAVRAAVNSDRQGDGGGIHVLSRQGAGGHRDRARTVHPAQPVVRGWPGHVASPRPAVAKRKNHSGSKLSAPDLRDARR